MGIRDEDLDAGMFEAFQVPGDESALQAIQRLHGAGSSLLLRIVLISAPVHWSAPFGRKKPIRVCSMHLCRNMTCLRRKAVC